MEVVVETSARHAHVSRKDLDILFGENYQLTKIKDLVQPGQFASEETVKVTGPRGSFPTVRILGPVRSATQVELSLSDARSIGLNVPLRESGDLSGSSPCKITGPKGEIDIPEGAIASKRHIHMTPADAKNFGFADGQVVSVKLSSSGRSLTFGDVVVRVREDFALEMHIDTDESNAAMLQPGAIGEMIP